VSKVQSLFKGINVCISVKLCCVVTKIGTRICLYTPYNCTKFQLDQSKHLRVRANFVICVKRRRKRKKTKKNNWNFGLSYLRNAWCDLFQFWNPASPHRWALPQQVWWSSVKRSRIYECLKIATLLFLLIYSLPFVRTQGFLGHTTHYHVSWYRK